MQNLVGIDSAITDLRMREKNTVCVDFFMNISVYLSVYPSVSSSGLQVTVLERLTLNGSNDVISQPLVPFDGHKYYCKNLTV